MMPSWSAQPVQRLRLTVGGAVQGVGFRPFVYRLAQELGLTGWVCNGAAGVVIEVEGGRSPLTQFLSRLQQDLPPHALIQQIEQAWLPPLGDRTFAIHPSRSGSNTALMQPDLAPCADCCREMNDPTHRRYRYPFINCTHCGPRFSIMTALPYDRPHTTMGQFQMCDRCQAEYDDPGDRRFHAQPNACSRCGPHLELWSPDGQVLASAQMPGVADPLGLAAQAIGQGQIVAVKGLGGFHLLVDAHSPDAVARLRQAKSRPHKPFALLYPDLETVRRHCTVSDLEAELLQSAAAPIVLLPRCGTDDLAPGVAPHQPYLGIMLPSTPLHHLLLAAVGRPVVATSGNLADEPLCTDEQDALQRLDHLVDCLLVHNRPIARPIDDSIVRVMAGQAMVLRRARGYAPLPVPLAECKDAADAPLLAVGAQQKNTVAVIVPTSAVSANAMLSQHLGDLDTVQAVDGFAAAIATLQDLYGLQFRAIACDAHPDYRSTQFAQQFAQQQSGLPLISVQHHYAHALACMAEHDLLGQSVLAVTWDGTGYGLDGTIWGGEWLHITPAGWERVAHLRPFPLPGGDRASREPRRAALGLLYGLFGDSLFESNQAIALPLLAQFSAAELAVLRSMLRRSVNTPLTSSAGRLFDAIAALLHLYPHTTYEGQAAMALEHKATQLTTDNLADAAYSFEFYPGQPARIDWAPTLQAILADMQAGIVDPHIAARFHNTLVAIIVEVAQRLRRTFPTADIVLAGGCWQNRYLTERTIAHLRAVGFTPHWPRQIPPNDGGIALGQLMAALRQTA